VRSGLPLSTHFLLLAIEPPSEGDLLIPPFSLVKPSRSKKTTPFLSPSPVKLFPRDCPRLPSEFQLWETAIFFFGADSGSFCPFLFPFLSQRYTTFSPGACPSPGTSPPFEMTPLSSFLSFLSFFAFTPSFSLFSMRNSTPPPPSLHRVLSGTFSPRRAYRPFRKSDEGFSFVVFLSFFPPEKNLKLSFPSLRSFNGSPPVGSPLP